MGFASTAVNASPCKRLNNNSVSRTSVDDSLLNGVDAEPPQFVQQQYRMSQPGIISNSCNWADVGIPDPVISFHRDGPTVQQQRV